MARKRIIGFETQKLSTTQNENGDRQNTRITGSVSLSATARTGAAAAIVTAISSFFELRGLGTSNNQDNYFQIAFRAGGGRTQTFRLIKFLDTATGATIASIDLSPGGSLLLNNTDTTQVNSASLVVQDNTWHVLEFRFRTSSTSATQGRLTVRLDGTQIMDGDASDPTNHFIKLGTSPLDQIQAGITTATGPGANVWLDDIIWDDAEYPGKAHVTFMKAISVAANSNWTKPGGGTTNLQTSVDNTPPVGIADSTASGDAEKQIRCPTNAQSTIDFDTDTYVANGVPSNATLMGILPIARVGCSSATSTSGELSLTQNPSSFSASTIDFSDAAAIAGTDPTNWRSVVASLIDKNYLDSIGAPSLTSAPRIRLRKQATTRVALCDLVGVYVDWKDTTPPTPNITAGPTAPKISRVAGKDSTDISFTADEDFVAYQIRVVPASGSSVTAGTQLESGSGGTAGTTYTKTVTDDELVAAAGAEGNNILKVFVQDAEGNWST